MATVRQQTARLGRDGALSISTEIREAAHLSEGDVVLLEAVDGGVLVRHIDPGQTGFWTEEWLAGEREIDEEIARGATPAVCATTEEFIARLAGVPPSDAA